MSLKDLVLNRASGTEVPKAPAPDGDLRFLDGLRGFAALYVMVYHARWLLWEGFYEGYQKHPELYSLGGKLLVYASSVFRYGHAAVMFFFVLSGFVIHLRYAKKLRASSDGTAKFDWPAYAFRRVRRLYPPLIFALLVTYLFDVVGQGRGYSIYFQSTPYQTMNDFVPHHDVSTLLGNLAFLMTTSVPFLGNFIPVFGTNGPLWSLNFEWWFYMLYPLFWWLSKRSIGLATAIVGALFILSRWSGLWPVELFRHVFSGMLFWWLGALLADIYTGRIAVKFSRIALLSGFLLFPSLFPLGQLRDFCWSLGFTGVIAGCFALQKRGLNLWFLNILKPIGDMSYTLYVTHLPIILLFSGWLMSRSASGELPRHFGWVLLGMAVTLSFSYVSHFVVEKPFLSRRPAKVAAPKPLLQNA